MSNRAEHGDEQGTECTPAAAPPRVSESSGAPSGSVPDIWQNADRGVFLGFPLDQLLNRRCPCMVTARIQKSGGFEGHFDPIIDRGIPGILRPTEDHPGTGVIVICGGPGSGKSTLALQIAAACAEERLQSRAVAGYVSLESSVEDLAAKAKPFGWDKYIRQVRHLAHVDQASSAPDLAMQLRLVLTPPVNCAMECGYPRVTCKNHRNRVSSVDVEPRILACTLSPRPIHATDRNASLFDTRFRQVQTLLSAAREMRDHPERNDPTILPLVVVDSLNMFGSGQLNREETHQLFGLFRRYETVGVFVVETSQDTPFDSTMADVVVRLSSTEDNGYYVRHIEVEKSRYVNQVNGKHPFKTVPEPVDGVMTPRIFLRTQEPGAVQPPRKGVVVFPSLHYSFLRLEDRERLEEIKEKEKSDWTPPGKRWGIPAMTHILPANLRDGSVIAIEGPRGTYKTNLALSFLAAGLANDESCMLVALRDRPLLTADKRNNALQGASLGEGLSWDGMRMCADSSESEAWQALIESRKAMISVSSKDGGKIDASACLFEVDFRSGALLAEEMIHLLWDIIIRRPKGHRIRRIVLDDVGEIGVGYPFLRKSQTSGDLFLPTLAHVMRNHGIDLVVTGTTGDLRESDHAIGRMRAVADAVVKCSFCDVFGQQHVLVQGVMAPPVDQAQGVTDYATVVREGDGFKLDTQRLSGLVGVGTGHTYRPGVTLQLYQESGKLHGEYNKRVLGMVSTRFCSPSINRDSLRKSERAAGKGSIHLMPFRATYSESVHDALQVLAGDEPFDTTVIRTVDEVKEANYGEFASFIGTTPEEIKQQLRVSEVNAEIEANLDRVRPYYQNVLLLAFDPDRTALSVGKDTLSWPGLWDAVKSGKSERKFWMDLSARETFSCALLDALLTGLSGPPSKAIEELSDQLNQGSTRPTEDQIDAVDALSKLLHETGWDPTLAKKERRKLERELPGDAGVYICWYTQLRDLLKRHPELSGKMQVRALPNAGFTGDWMIGVVRGSASVKLGSGIVDSLCGTKEQIKRYIMGVGLPVNNIGLAGASVPAWPCATQRLSDILTIHDNAKHRGKIAEYATIRSSIAAAAMQLGPVSGGVKMQPDMVTQAIVDLFSQTRELVNAAR